VSFTSTKRHTRSKGDWRSDVGSSDQSADAGRKSLVVFGLDDEVYVILLHGVVHYTKRLAIAVAQPTEQRARYLLRAQRSQTRAQRDVNRVRLSVSRPRSMRRLPQISR